MLTGNNFVSPQFHNLAFPITPLPLKDFVR
jgi:hypothetical protein